jgi:hypothetical protein
MYGIRLGGGHTGRTFQKGCALNVYLGMQCRYLFSRSSSLERSRTGLNPHFSSKIETVAQDHLYDEMIGAGGQPEADAEIELPLGGEIKVNRGE